MWGTIIVAGILVVIIAAILFCMRKDRKNGKGSCGGDCSKCKGCLLYTSPSPRDTR